jgi:hypothetical protein
MAASLDDIVTVNIEIDTISVDVASFGVPLIVASHNHWADLARVYNSSDGLATMVQEGFLTSEPPYVMASRIVSSTPRVSSFVIGRRSTAAVFQQTTKITPTITAAVINTYSGTVNGVAWTFSTTATPTLAAACTGIAASIGAISGVTANGTSGTSVTVTTTAPGTIASIGALKATPGTSTLKAEDTTADSSIAADLAAIQAVNDTWYGFVIDSPSDEAKEDAAEWAESQIKIFGVDINGTAALDTTITTDLASKLKAASYTRTFGIYHSDPKAYAAAAWIGAKFPRDPHFGDTWNFATLSGVPVEVLSSTALAALKTKCVNRYVEIAGLSITQSGYTFEGVNNFIDLVTGRDEMHARVQEAVFTLLATAQLTYTNESVDLVCQNILRVLDVFVKGGFLKGGADSPVCTGPRVEDVPQADKLARNLPDVEFTAQLASRIHTVHTIQGKVAI